MPDPLTTDNLPDLSDEERSALLKALCNTLMPDSAIPLEGLERSRLVQALQKFIKAFSR